MKKNKIKINQQFDTVIRCFRPRWHDEDRRLLELINIANRSHVLVDKENAIRLFRNIIKKNNIKNIKI